MKTVYYTATSLDGYIADENNSLEWLFAADAAADADSPDDRSPDDRSPDDSASLDAGHGYDAFIATIGAVAMGATTYEWMLEHHLDAGNAWPYRQPTWVFTHRDLHAVSGADIRFVSGDVGRVHAEMAAAAAGLNLWIVGGGDLAGQFHDLGLLNEIVVSVAPVTLGAGAPLLPRAITPPSMRLTGLTQSGPFAQLTFAVATDAAP
ncbi:dihydrofolate reductase family protein [Microbacterium sp. STN6]|uniref:dihydrofolate reductase family protein n=1 Tax=Microbacterium sp. STN6 TaxID=2995588 RepID=UPI002260F5A7|nr:dihydrofolate reductase family protein [Microbacterium sp. STN6]MCX7522897.1 dihydrofolate reductase family protein [Microbacterium sp. STN6]